MNLVLFDDYRIFRRDARPPDVPLTRRQNNLSLNAVRRAISRTVATLRPHEIGVLVVNPHSILAEGHVNRLQVLLLARLHQRRLFFARLVLA